MARNDPVIGAENIVQLPKLRRAPLTVPRSQPPAVVGFDSWVECRDKAVVALLSGTKRVLLTGPAGTGKTVLLDHVARVLRAAGRTVIIQLADIDPAPPEAGVTLFVDEADRLPDAKRQALLGAPGTVVLAGLGTPPLRRVPAGTLQLTLAPLGREAARDYVAQWLDLTGRTPDDLDSAAVRRLVELSGGTPRLLSTLLTAASWVAETSGAPIITAAHVDEAAELRSILLPTEPPPASAPMPTPRRGRMSASVLLTGGVLVMAAAAAAPRLFPAETHRTLERSKSLVDAAETWLRLQWAGGTPAAPAPVAPPPPVIAKPEPPPAIAPPTIAPPTIAPPTIDSPAIAPPVIEPQVAAAPEPAPEPVQAVTAPAAPPPVPAAAKPALPRETIAFLIRRGREMMALNDFSAARLLFRRAADDGSADAMFHLAATYDPANLDPVDEHGQANAAEAMRWYRRAADAGSLEAARHVSNK